MQKGTLPLCACLKDRMLSECGLCKVEPAMTRQPWSVRGMRIAAEVPETIAKPATREENSSSEESELEEGESAECKHVSHTQLMRLLNCGIA